MGILSITSPIKGTETAPSSSLKILFGIWEISLKPFKSLINWIPYQNFYWTEPQVPRSSPTFLDSYVSNPCSNSHFWQLYLILRPQTFEKRHAYVKTSFIYTLLTLKVYSIYLCQSLGTKACTWNPFGIWEFSLNLFWDFSNWIPYHNFYQLEPQLPHWSPTFLDSYISNPHSKSHFWHFYLNLRLLT